MCCSIKDIFVLLGFVFLCLLAGMMSSYFMADSLANWYPSLIKSSITPPDWVFAPVWTVLYVLMGVAMWFIWISKENDSFPMAALLFLIQLFLNVLWTFCFFYWQNPMLGLIDLVGLDLALFLTIFAFFRISKKAAFLLFPYFLWLMLATYLNLYIVWAN